MVTTHRPAPPSRGPLFENPFEPVHEEADMETFWAAYDDLLAGVLDGRVADAPLVLAVLLVRARGLVTAG